MTKKPTKWGMKAFILADSVPGYTYNWRLYAGKQKQHNYTYIYIYMCVWQSRIEIEYYSVVYFEHITKFDVL